MGERVGAIGSETEDSEIICLMRRGMLVRMKQLLEWSDGWCELFFQDGEN